MKMTKQELIANVVVTILTALLILFGLSNLYKYRAGLFEYKSSVGFYIFSLATLFLQCGLAWISVEYYDDVYW